MKKLLSVLMLTVMVLAFAGMVGATPICATFETTFVSGTITDATNGNAPVAGADVTVTCGIYTRDTESGANGGYAVEFTNAECPLNSAVSVAASYDGLNGENDEVTWSTSDSTIGCLRLIVDVACVDVPLVPEFGALVASLTIFGALGAFFLIRRK
ncbi:MAG: hypothetical protein NTZ83_06775 [Candidatus Pacearchaeota archaeon]|nr:hypothetical protein [Candidatus Pacearchaeota archaeon]